MISHTEWSKSHLKEAINYLYLRDYLDKANALASITVFEFGVFRGASCSLMDSLFVEKGIPARIVGFDSFSGLPPEDENVERWRDFTPGAFSLQGLCRHLPASERITYVDTWFSELGQQTITNYSLSPASLIHIDCDLYVSTLQALEFLFSNELVKEGAVIAYDEFRSTEDLTKGGESKAHMEIADKYGIEFKEFYRNIYRQQIDWWQNCFVIDKINSPCPNHGIYTGNY